MLKPLIAAALTASLCAAPAFAQDGAQAPPNT
jgi:hypothetical protein